MSMEFLKPIFEDQLAVEYDPYTQKVTIGATPFYAIQMLRSDEEAYRDEFARWLNDVWLPEQAEFLDQILNIHANRKRYEDLCSTLGRGALVPLVGSGMSAPSGLPLWSDFLTRIRKHSLLSEEDLESFLAQSKYEEAVDAIAESMPNRLFEERVEHDLRIADADGIVGSVSFLPMLFSELVLTTNLDNLLEKLYAKHRLVFSEVLKGDEIGRYRRLKGHSDRILIKLHGDCKSSDGRILSVSQYEEYYRKGASVFEELATIYRNYSVLCLGCSMKADRTVDVLAEVAQIDPGVPKHYAFLKRPCNEDRLLEREHFLTERDVFPIWFDGDHDESITALLVGMVRYMGVL